MKKQKLYFQRHYDQWKGLDIAIEEEVDGHGLYIQVPDMDMTDGSVTSISAEFEGIGSRNCTVYDETKRIIRVEMPLTILANDGLYEVSFTMAYNSKGTENRIEKTAIQTFTILDTIEIPEEEILADDRYNLLTELLNKVQDEEVDVSIFAKKEEVVQLINEALNGVNIESIITELELRGLYITPEQLTQRLNEALSKYVDKFGIDNYLTAYVKTEKLNERLRSYATTSSLNDYVRKETGKTLTSNDFTTELKRKLENIPEDGNYDDTELRDMINKKADTSTVIDLVNSINTISREDFYDKTAINGYIEDITNMHEEDISNIEEDVYNIEEELSTFLKKEDYQYSDGINTNDVSFNERTLTDVLSDLLYKEIEIKSFNSTLITHLYEFNAISLNSITLKWELSKNPVSQSINNYNGVLSADTREITINNVIKSDTDFILTVTDEKGTEKTATISLKFVHPSYYGTYEDVLGVDNVTDGNKIIMDNVNKTIDMSYTNKKIFFAYPKYFGELVDIKDNNGLSYFDDFIYDGVSFGMNGTSYNVYKLDTRATVKNISYSLIFEKEEE